jgi:hypothetical protein
MTIFSASPGASIQFSSADVDGDDLLSFQLADDTFPAAADGEDGSLCLEVVDGDDLRLELLHLLGPDRAVTLVRECRGDAADGGQKGQGCEDVDGGLLHGFPLAVGQWWSVPPA